MRNRNSFGKKFRRQHSFRGFIFDFYCPERKLAIELDGLVHLKSKDYDRERGRIIESHGVRILRFKNSEIKADIVKVLRSIKKLTLNPSPSLMEKGVMKKQSFAERWG